MLVFLIRKPFVINIVVGVSARLVALFQLLIAYVCADTMDEPRDLPPYVIEHHNSLFV